jgi:hypothetical protein
VRELDDEEEDAAIEMGDLIDLAEQGDDDEFDESGPLEEEVGGVAPPPPPPRADTNATGSHEWWR